MLIVHIASYDVHSYSTAYAKLMNDLAKLPPHRLTPSASNNVDILPMRGRTASARKMLGIAYNEDKRESAHLMGRGVYACSMRETAWLTSHFGRNKRRGVSGFVGLLHCRDKVVSYLRRKGMDALISLYG